MAETGTLSASTTAMSLSDTATPAADHTQSPKINLPLPRELRDKIWGYLLYHEYVHVAPYSDWPDEKKGEESEKNARAISRAHIFKLHTPILAVHHKIYEECLKVLKSNDFVVVTYRSPLRGIAKHVTSLPIVTENPEDSASFRYHTMSVDLRAAMATVLESNGRPPKGSFVIVATDLPRFCRMLQKALYAVPAITKYVYDDPEAQVLRNINCSTGEPPANLPKIDFGTYVKIEFPNGPKSFDQATKFLGAFRHVVHANLQVSILNYPKGMKPEIFKLTEVMAPKAVWLKAMVWHILEYCQWELAEAKASAEAGDLQHAIARFNGVVELHSLMPFNLPADKVYSSAAGIPIALLALTILDAGVTENILRIRLAGMIHDKTPTITNALDFVCHFFIKLPRSVVRVALSMLGYKLGGAPPPPISRFTMHE